MLRTTLITLLSIAALLSGTAWGVSYGRRIQVAYLERLDYAREWAVHRGVLQFVSETHLPRPLVVERQYDRTVGGIVILEWVIGYDLQRRWTGYSFDSPRSLQAAGYATLIVVIPLWVPTTLLGIYPLIALARGFVRRLQRRRAGMCLRCGYDLTGNLSCTCPKCGIPVRRQTNSST